MTECRALDLTEVPGQLAALHLFLGIHLMMTEPIP